MYNKKLIFDLIMVQLNINEINNLKNQQIQKIENIDTKIIIEQPKNSFCGCYDKELSNDMRCCGLCYCYCQNLNKEDQCNCCNETFKEYYNSGYFITTSGYGNTEEPCENCVCTIMCLPFKFPLFFSCFLGSIFNNMINICRNTNNNYLC